MTQPGNRAGRPRPRSRRPVSQPGPGRYPVSQMRGAEPDQGRCAVVLTPPARHLHLTVLEAFAETGRAPHRAELEGIARSKGADPGPVLAELAGQDLLALDGSGEVR